MAFSMAMVYYELSGNCYSSPLLSFAAIYSVKLFTKIWKELGNYNSFLSGLTWVV